MEFRLLGPLEVIAEGRVVPLDAPKQRALLALLLVRANEPVSRDLLIEELWAGRPPPSATKLLQTYVSQLRRVLGRDVIRTAPSAYELRADAGSFDLYRFEELVANARTASPAMANGMLREALSLWRGQPLAEFAYEPWTQPEIDRLEKLRLDALQERIESDLALGASAELVALDRGWPSSRLPLSDARWSPVNARPGFMVVISRRHGLSGTDRVWGAKTPFTLLD